MMRNTSNRGSLLATTVLAGLLFATPASAQQTATQDADDQANQEVGVQSTADSSPNDSELQSDDEEIVVTGSRIQRRDLTSTSPLAVVNDEEFKLTGTVNAEQVINTLPQVLPGTTSFSNNPGGGVATINLRGLGTERNLVLVNGRRYIFFDASQVVDINTVPSFLIDSVDVVTGGASAVYGSDALAGVVNFRLRDDVDGAEFGGTVNITEEGDGRRYNVYGLIGTRFADNRGYVVGFGEYYNRQSVFQGDRPFSRFALGDNAAGTALVPGGSAATPQGRVFVATNQTVGTICDGTTVVFQGFGGDTNCDGATDAADRAALTRAAGNFGGLGANFGTPGVSDPFDNPGDLYNYAPANYLQVPQERYSLGGYGEFEISSAVTAFGEATFINNRVANELAATPVTGTFQLNLANISPFLSAADLAALTAVDANETAINEQLNARCAAAAAAGRVGGTGPNSVSGCATVAGTNTLTGTATGLLPGAGIVTAGVNRRTIETGPRNTLDERNAFRILGGVKGPVVGDFDYELYYSYARTRNANIQEGNISRSAFTNELAAGRLNVFGAGTITPANLEAIAITAQNSEISTLEVASGSVAGTLGNFGLGGGDIGVAVGAEYRRIAAEFLPDTALSSGDVIGFNAGDPTEGSYNVREIFGEVRIPIVGDRPFLNRLELTAAGRYSDYSLDAVGGVPSYAVGLEFSPVRDITFRGQYQRAVRAPNIVELFGGQSNGFPGATDPCAAAGAATDATVRALCIATGVPAGLVGSGATLQPNTQIEGLFGGNPNLQEETGDTYTVGAVIRPSFIPGLSLTVDGYRITVEDQISTLGGGLNNTLNLCYNVIQDINSVYCQAIQRDPANGQIGGEFLPQILNANIGKLETQGIDFQVDYSRPFGNVLFGRPTRVNFFFLGTYTDKFDITPVADLEDEVNECAGRFGQLACGDPTPKFKASSRVSLIGGPLTASLRWRHVGKVRDDDDETDYVVERLRSYNLFDLAFSIDATDQMTFAFGVNNLLDKKPQRIGDNQEQANTYPGTYDVLGRDFFVSANFRF